MRPDGRILDYGCGSGDAVLAGVRAGLDVFGVEVFYGGGHGQREKAAELGLLNDRVFEMPGGRIPFPDESFDLVYHTQVFEHVQDLDQILSEIRRVLRPDGVMLSLFPSLEVIREGHCGVVFAHRLRRDSKLGYAYLLIARTLGFGYYHGAKSRKQWASDFLEWLDEWCFYRPRTEIVAAYRRAGFSFEPREAEYAMHRLRYTGRRWAVPLVKMLPGLAGWAIRMLGGMVVLSKKTTEPLPLHRPRR
jgi:SAM-dependent methyltransferase